MIIPPLSNLFVEYQLGQQNSIVFYLLPFFAFLFLFSAAVIFLIMTFDLNLLKNRKRTLKQNIILSLQVLSAFWILSQILTSFLWILKMNDNIIYFLCVFIVYVTPFSFLYFLSYFKLMNENNVFNRIKKENHNLSKYMTEITSEISCKMKKNTSLNQDNEKLENKVIKLKNEIEFLEKVRAEQSAAITATKNNIIKKKDDQTNSDSKNIFKTKAVTR
ncbi:hypothetical protein [Cysteiniphilum marinum]|uniref:hypothetical protein n=1 Tax=Cysteiniphilum marinum TaxID=2774191 RepID=UPI00193B00B4|nr:hypothetical protein [Cysteiniphilum marinum]